MMRVRFRTYCYGCRRGARWCGRCLWRAHRWDWEYWISCDGRRILQRGGFRTWERARKSAERSWFKLAALSCVDPAQPGVSNQRSERAPHSGGPG